MDREPIRALQRRQLHPELYMKETEIDRHSCERVVPMEVLSLGMPRTGTSSIKAALQILGYNDVYHMTNTWTNPLDVDMWMEAYDAAQNKSRTDGSTSSSGSGSSDSFFGRAQWDKLLGHCMAVADAPAITFAPDLIVAYPSSKVILVSRDMDAWHASISKAIDVSFRRELAVLAWLDPLYAGRLYRIARRNMAVLFRARSAREAKANARVVFEEHYRRIREVTPMERLLEYELGSGWAPLCEFLGKEVPDARFPVVSESKVFEDMADGVNMKCLERALANAGIGFVLLLFTAWMLYMAKSYIFVNGLPDWRSEL